MDGSDAIDTPATENRGRALAPPSPSAVQWRSALLLLITVGCAVTAAANWHSPVRTTLAIVFVMLVPGGAIAELLQLTEPLTMLAVAVGGSIALGTAVSVSLLYAHAWSLGLVTGILIGVTVLALLVALARARRAGRRASEA